MLSRAEEFGHALQERFLQLSANTKPLEIPLFRHLQAALISTSRDFLVEEFHGNRSQVLFPATNPWTKSIACCELSDLCVIWFRERPVLEARVTFIQAKYSKRAHSLCQRVMNTDINERFVGDSTQWYLLNRRPSIIGRYPTFKPPSNLLADAPLPSVCSYCVFHRGASQKFSFFYASADIISASPTTKPGRVKLTAAYNVPFVSGLFDEQKWACCPFIFGKALYSGYIGAPFHYDHAANEADSRWRSSIRAWLGSILGSVGTELKMNSIVETFRKRFEIPASGAESTIPARSILFIKADDEGP